VRAANSICSLPLWGRDGVMPRVATPARQSYYPHPRNAARTAHGLEGMSHK
jgi:hypothetical protein